MFKGEESKKIPQRNQWIAFLRRLHSKVPHTPRSPHREGETAQDG